MKSILNEELKGTGLPVSRNQERYSVAREDLGVHISGLGKEVKLSFPCDDSRPNQTSAVEVKALDCVLCS